MARLASLPSRPQSWEIGLARGAIEVEGLELDGLIFVVEAETSLLRLAAPLVRGEDPARVVREAFEAPSQGTRPGRPKLVRCADPELLRALGPLLAEARTPGVVAETPVLDEAVDALRGALGRPAAPGITEGVQLWRPLLDRLLAAAPWDELPDSVEFSFEGGALDGSVLVVLGLARQVIGLALYPSRRDLLAFRRFLGDPSAIAQVRCVTLQFETASELTEAERAACAGLVPPAGPFPRVFALDGGPPERAEPAQQAALRRAIEGLLAICEGRLAIVAAGEPAEARVGDAVVRVRRRGGSGRAAPPLAERGAIVLMTLAPDSREPALPALVLKFRKADAERVAGELGGVVGIELIPRADGLHISATYRIGGARRIAVLAPGDRADAVHRHFTAPEAWLVVAGGGTTRTVRQQDLVRVVHVEVRR